MIEIPGLPTPNAQQLVVLRYINGFWVKHRQWPTALDLRLDLSKEGISSDLILLTLPPFVTFLDKLPDERTVRLTIAGAFHCENGKDIAAAFLAFIRQAAHSVIESPSREANVSKKEFRELLPTHLEPECDRLSMLLVDQWWGYAGGGGLPGSDWDFRCDQTVVRFHNVDSIEEFLYLKGREAKPVKSLEADHIRLLCVIYRYRRMFRRWPNYAGLIVAHRSKADAEYLLGQIPENFSRTINKHQAPRDCVVRLEFDAATAVPAAAPDLELLNPIIQELCKCFVDSRGKGKLTAVEVADSLKQPLQVIVRAGFFLQYDFVTGINIEEKGESWIAWPTEKVRKFEGSKSTEEFLARRRAQQMPSTKPDEPIDLGPWICQEKLGGGGQASTYLVRRHDDPDAKLLVMKVLKPWSGAEGKASSESDQRDRFTNEVNSLKEMNEKGCPRVATVLDENLKPAVGQPWFVMPYYSGGAMSKPLEKGGLTYAEDYQGNLDRLLAVAESVARTLAFMHEHGAVHRDVKTGNVFFNKVGGDPVLGDFGLVYSPSIPKGFDTKEPEAFGPWQSRPSELHPGSDDKRNPKADVYLLGGLIYEAISKGKYIERPEHRPGEFVHEKPDFALAQFSRDPRIPQINDLLRCMWADDPNGRLSVKEVAELCLAIRQWKPGNASAVTKQTGLHLGQAATRLREDIERLKNYTSQNALLLSERSSITASSGEVKIDRACVRELLRASKDTSLLVVGEPGVGKSGVLYELTQAVRAAGHHVLLIDVGRTEAPSLDALRVEMGLHYDLLRVLEHWSGEKPAYLVVDAMDAARSEPAARAIRDLVALVAQSKGRWRVIASIRKFDLRYSRDLRALFEGKPPTDFVDLEFHDLRHVNIPLLNDQELASITAPELVGIIAGSTPSLRQLLRNPFNLWIANELLQAGMKVDGLAPMKSQQQLLDRYWEYRVIRKDGRGDDREALLRKTCEKMVSARTLRTQRTGLADGGEGRTLDDLLKASVLVEWQPSANAPPDRYVIAFSHHILFDFAVARVIFRSDLEGAVTRLEKDPELVIAVRPSLMLLFNELWSLDKDRQRYWEFVLKCAASKTIPEIGKTVGPAVTTELARLDEDVDRLPKALQDENAVSKEAAENVYRNLFGALVAGPAPLAGTDSGPWHSLALKISEKLRLSLCYALRTLLYVMTKQVDQLTPTQRSQVNAAARNGLAFVWDLSPRDRNLVLHFMDSVCITFRGEPTASAAALRRVLEPERVKAYGYEEMPELCRGVKHIVPVDPSLVEEIYRTAFCSPTPDASPTPIGGSRILPMSSTRKQDWESGQWNLEGTFEQFLESWPLHATRALVAAIESYAATEHEFSPPEGGVQTIQWGNLDASFLTDGSSVWDSDTASSDDQHKMLVTWHQYVSGLAANPTKSKELQDILETVRGANRQAVIWRRLMENGSEFPETLGKLLLPLMVSNVVLSSVDTYRLVGHLIASVFAHLGVDERLEVEKAVTGLADEELRNDLLRLLPIDFTSAGTKATIESLPKETAHEGGNGGWKAGWGSGPDPYKGIPEQLGDKEICEAEAPVKVFLEQHRNTVPTLGEATAIVARLIQLEHALDKSEANKANTHVVKSGWEVLTQSCERVASIEGLSCCSESAQVMKRIFLKASKSPYPEPEADGDAKFSHGTGWAPEPRVVAAEGLMQLAYSKDCVDAVLIEVIERLSQDKVPAVRRQIVVRLLAFQESAPELMWRLVRKCAEDDRSFGVLRGLVDHTLGWLARKHVEEVVDILRGILGRAVSGGGAEALQEPCVSILLGAFVLHDHVICKEVVHAMFVAPENHSNVLMHMMWELRDLATVDSSATLDGPGVRARTLDLFLKVVKACRAKMAALESSYAAVKFDAWPKETQSVYESLLKVLDSAATNMYFASGSYAEHNEKKGNRLTIQQRARFYMEAAGILDELTEVGFAAIAHHLVEILEECVSFDPRGVFVRVGQVIRLGQQGGYQYESAAVDRIVKLISLYLSEHRALLRSDEECRQVLIETLDTFVNAGWPKARTLTYHLEEIFR